MMDSEKTREQLIADLAAARLRISELEADKLASTRAEDALLYEQSFTQTLLSSLPGIFYLYTYPELRLVRWNTNHEKLLGFEPGEIENRHIMDWHHPKYRGLVQQAIETVIEKGHNTIESPLLAKDGRHIPFLMTGIKFEHLGKTYLMGVGMDITDRKRAEEALRESEARVRLLVESAPDAIFIQLEGRFAFLNQATLRLFGAQRPEDLLGTSILDRIHPDMREKIRERIRSINAEHEQLPVLEERYLRLDGTVVEVEVKAVPFIFEGKHSGLVFVRDITERKRAEEVMIQSEKMITVGGLAAGMAHEINNPLGGILQSLQNIKRRISFNLPANVSTARDLGCSLGTIRSFLKEREILEFLDSIEESGKRAARIVANMLEFSRKGTSGRALVAVNELVEKSMSLCASGYYPENKCSFKSILVERDLDPNIPMVSCIPSQIEQVLVNLLQNAEQALESQNGGADASAKIIVRTRGETDTVRIEIEDNGPGMEPEVLRRVFDPFFTTKPVGKGTGLGLSVAYFIIRNNHGGTLEVESRPGKGARFIVRLPLAQAFAGAAGGESVPA